MGAYLSEPIREKDSIDESLDQLTYGASCMQGWRVSQEVAIFHVSNSSFQNIIRQLCTVNGKDIEQEHSVGV